jgi:hypothetical protein
MFSENSDDRCEKGIWILFYFNYYELIYMKKENFMENNVTVNEYIYIYIYIYDY